MSNIEQDLKIKSYPPCDLKLLATNTIICYLCKRIIVNAHQTDDCGCRFCFECLDELVFLFLFFKTPKIARTLSLFEHF
jgi:hypothetical protein